jgi:arylsulfatase A-like enzyme
MADDRPNVLLITVHDLGTRLGCYGVENVPSPRLDAFAAGGVRLARHFATATFCSPSRGGIVSGQYPHVNGLMGLCNLGWDWRPEKQTLAKVLGAAGYETFLFGFQHEARPEHVDRLGLQHVSDRDKSYRCPVVIPMVEDFLRARSSDRPFYARVGTSEVHRTFDRYPPEDPAAVRLPPHITDTPGARQDFAMYDGCIRGMDAHMGRLFDALDASGLRDNTVVVFTTDHGSPFPRAKATTYDPGIRTTLLMQWPGVLPEGRVVDELISNVDLFPTLCDMAGAEPPEPIQGRSFLPLLTGGEYTPRDCIFAEKNTHPEDLKRCIRTERFKYIRNLCPGPRLFLPVDIESSLTRRDMGSEHLAPRPDAELYDLDADPNEVTNLAGQPAYAEIECELAARLRAIQEETDDLALKGPVPRPADEAGIIRRVRSTLDERSTYARDGLRAGWEIVDDS